MRPTQQVRQSPSPWGEGGPASAGSDEGAIQHPTYRQNRDVALTGWWSVAGSSAALGTGSPPHQSPAVTASPQGEANALRKQKSVSERVFHYVKECAKKASQTSGARRRRNQIKSIFSPASPGKKYFSAASVNHGRAAAMVCAQSAAIPQFLKPSEAGSKIL